MLQDLKKSEKRRWTVRRLQDHRRPRCEGLLVDHLRKARARVLEIGTERDLLYLAISLRMLKMPFSKLYRISPAVICETSPQRKPRNRQDRTDIDVGEVLLIAEV